MMKDTFVMEQARVYCVRGSRKITETGPLTETTEGLTLLAVRNGYEGGQVVIAAKEGRALYLEPSFSLSPLKSEAGDVYAAENCQIFVEKYIYVDRNWQKNGYPTGNYPDALLPFEKAVPYGEHLIESGKKKSYYFDFFIPKEQPAGRYSGELTVRAEGEIKIPVRLEVLPLTLPDTTKVRTLFNTNTHHMKRYEHTDGKEMLQKYCDFLLEHRVCQSNFYLDASNDAEVEGYVKKALAMVKRGYNTISVPAYEWKEEGINTFDARKLKRDLLALGRASVENEIDLVARSVFYDWLIDEPFGGSMKDGQVKNAIERFKQTIADTLAACEKEEIFQTPFGKKVTESIRRFPHLITDYYEREYFPFPKLKDEKGEPYRYDMKEVLLCPKFDGYDTEELAAPYAENIERWWYGCNAPNSPFPGYHIDDAGFMPRLISWLMSEWDIVGNLYWANNIYSEFNRTGGEFFLQDAYQTAHRGTGANGEGAILYPGLPFQIDGPVGCLRLKAIRDGHQDYDLFEQVKEVYEEKGSSFKSIFSRTLDCLRKGTKVDSFADCFENAKEALMRLSEGALSEAEILLTVEKKEGGLFFESQGAEGISFALDGAPLGKNRVAFTCPYQKGGWRVFTASYAGKEYSIPLFVGKGVDVLMAEVLHREGKIQAKKTALNTHEIFRKVEVEGKTSITLPYPVTAEQTLEIELRTEAPTKVKLGLEKGKKTCVCLQKGWGRVALNVEKGGQRIVIDEVKGGIALGDVFING